ncbi:unnamed protein product [Mucor fragilis]
MFSADKFLKTECLSSYLKRSEIISAFKEFAYKDSGLKKVSSKSVLYAKELFDCYNKDESIAPVSFVPENKQEEGSLKV